MSQIPRPSTPRSRQRPIERFLGPDEAAGGPFALLGLSATAVTDDLVLSGLDRQVERIAQHPECDTPEADEVRLALHAAAAQLLDPVVRRHLIAKWTGAKPPPVPARGGVQAPAAAARRALPEKLLEADAILALALYGGWNQRSMRRLLKVAHARGFTNRQVATTLRNFAGRRRSTRAAPTRAAAPMRRARSRQEFESAERGPVAAPSPPLVYEPRPPIPAAPVRPIPGPAAPSRPRPAGAPPLRRPVLPEPEIDPGQQILRNALIFGGVGLAGLIAAVVAIIVLTSSSPPLPKPPAPVPGATGSTSTTGVSPVPPSVAPDHSPPPPPKRAALPPPTDTSDPALLTRELAACADGVQAEPAEATDRFERAVARLASAWPQVPRDRLIACHDAVIEFIYKSGLAPDLSMRAVRAVAAGAAALAATTQPSTSEVAPAVWSTGLLVRLVRERDLSAAAKAAIDAQLGASLGPARPAIEQTFEAGAAAALSLLPMRLSPPASQGASGAIDLDAWKKWADCVDALAAGDSTARVRLLLAGLETLLIQAPEPSENRGVAEVAGELVQRLTWRPQDESRRWLLRWFDDRRITAADLHAITSALATRSSADGVDLTMVLSTSASDKNRADLRERFATVWSMQQAMNRDQLTAAWVAAAKDAITASLSGGDDADKLASAAVLARASEAAWWQWRGEGGEAAAIVADLRGPVEQAKTPPMPAPFHQRLQETDGGWAEKYLAAGQKNRVKREMLDTLATSISGELGPVDAEVVAREAFMAGSAELRTPAQEIVKRLSDTPPMLSALLELLPRAQRNASNSSLIEAVCQRQLPRPRDPDWPIVARRILVEKLLEAIASESPLAKVDRMAALLAVSYRAMAAPAPLPPDQRAQLQQPAAAASAAQVWQRWRAAADAIVPTSPPPIPLDQIDRRRAGRIGQARGMVQAFSAQETSLCEIMAYVVNAEQPARADQIKSVLDRLAEDRRHAGSILEQINATERAILQLWLIRYQEDPA